MGMRRIRLVGDSNGTPRRRSLGVLRGMSPTLELRTVQTPTGGSSEEYWSMGGSLNQPYRVQEEGLMDCKLLLYWGNDDVENIGEKVQYE